MHDVITAASWSSWKIPQHFSPDRTTLHLPCKKPRAQAKHPWKTLSDAHVDTESQNGSGWMGSQWVIRSSLCPQAGLSQSTWNRIAPRWCWNIFRAIAPSSQGLLTAPTAPGGVLGLSQEWLSLMADSHLERWRKCPGHGSASPAARFSFSWLWTCKLLSPPADFNASLYCMEMFVLLCETLMILLFYFFFCKCRQNNPVFHELILRNTRHISSVFPPRLRL